MTEGVCSSCNRRPSDSGLKTCNVCRKRIRRLMRLYYARSEQHKKALAGRERRRIEDQDAG